MKEIKIELFIPRLALAAQGSALTNRFDSAEKGTVFHRIKENNMNHKLAYDKNKVLEQIAAHGQSDKIVFYDNLDQMLSRSNLKCKVTH